jgi:hypothetical protein
MYVVPPPRPFLSLSICNNFIIIHFVFHYTFCFSPGAKQVHPAPGASIAGGSAPTSAQVEASLAAMRADLEAHIQLKVTKKKLQNNVPFMFSFFSMIFSVTC